MHPRNSLLALLALPPLILAPSRPAAVQLGNIELAGGTVKKTVDTNAITPGEGDELVGTITNNTGSPVDDVTVSVNRASSSASVPTSTGDTTITDSGGSSSADNGATADGFTANVSLGQQGGASVIQSNGSASLGVDVTTTGDGTTVEVLVTPSVNNKPTGSQMHADLMLRFKLSDAAPGAIHALSLPYHDRAAMLVLNDSGKDIVSFEGVCTLPAGVTLSSVHLQDPSSSYNQVPGTTVQITGNAFEITGFSSLESGTNYEVVTVFSGTPAGLYKVSLEAGF